MTDRPHPIPWTGPAVGGPTVASPPKTWGEGTWNTIYFTAVWADTPEKMAFFCEWVRYICANLPCNDCTGHAAAYLVKNPPEKADDPFVWVWEFQNSVCIRLGKPPYPFAGTRDRYYGGKVKQCASCGGQPEKVQVNTRS